MTISRTVMPDHTFDTWQQWLVYIDRSVHRVRCSCGWEGREIELAGHYVRDGECVTPVDVCPECFSHKIRYQ